MGIKIFKGKKFMKSIMKVMVIMLFICFSISLGIVPAGASDNDKDAKNEDYTLTLEEMGGNKETIYGSTINLKYDTENAKVVSYDEALLKACVDKLSCLNESEVTDYKNAIIKYENGEYRITKEVNGNRVKKDVLYNTIKEAVDNNVRNLDLYLQECYEMPKFVENSPLVSYAKETLDKYVSSNITYKIEGTTQVIGAATIKDWIGIDDDFNPVLSKEKVKDRVQELAASYNSLSNAEENIETDSDGSHYIWAIDVDTETERLVSNIKNGDSVIKEPAYKKVTVVIPEKPVVSETGSSYGQSTVSGVGNTYVAINLTTQHLWFYKNGALIVEGDVVTGNESTGCATPTGTYKLYYKQKNTILRGPGYASPVSFWMPFNGGIGLHDASWRSVFGGNIYKTSGSHGCVNAPYYVAKAVYDNISSGDYIVVYR